MIELQERLLIENPQFRRIWVQYAHKGNYKIVITLFPHGYGAYRMVFGESQDLSYDSINKILQSKL